MGANHKRVVGIRALILSLLFLLTMTSGALADRSPAGLVDDRAGLLSAEQLAQLDAQLAGKRFHYQVVILPKAFDEENPPNQEALFRGVAMELMSALDVEPNGVLITVAMKERLVDFRVWDDGPVNQSFRQATGQDFGALSDRFLQAFTGPAASGDMAGGILAAVRTMEEQVATPSATPPTTPPTRPSTPPSTRPYVTPEPPPSGGPDFSLPASFWWWLLGLLGVGVSVRQTVHYTRFRRRLRALLAVRDGFLDQLLDLTERKLPLARNFAGPETRKLAMAAQADSERSLHAHQDGDTRLQEAERLARQMRFSAAHRALDEIQRAFEEAAAACQTASAAYAPIGQAIHQWDSMLAESHTARDQAQSGLDGARQQTGWALPLLAKRLAAGSGQVAAGEQVRDEDPVQAITLLSQGLAALELTQVEIGSLLELQKRYQTLQSLRNQGEREVEAGRQTLGLRYVERDPEEHLVRAAQHDQEMARLLPEGDVTGASQAHQNAEEAVQAATAIVAAYRLAVAEIPVKTVHLGAQLESLPPDIATADRVTAELSTRFATDDWLDLADLPGDLTSLRERIRKGLTDVENLARPTEQRYLTALSLLDELLAERERARQQLQLLTERPAQLDEAARTAAEQLRQAQGDWQESLRRIEREHLRLLSQRDAEAARVEQQIREAEGIGSRRPLPVRQWEQATGEAARLARAFRQAIDELAYQANEARSRLNQAMAQSGDAARYESYDRSQAARRYSAMEEAEQALAEGYYAEAMAQANMALQAMQAMEAAYRAYQAEQERRRREEERRHAAQQRRTSGGGGNWGSGGTKTSGGGGSWGGGGGNKTSGGGGKW